MNSKKCYPGAIAHIYNRGVDRRNIFEDDYDRARFLATMHLSNHPSAPNMSGFRRRTPEEILAMSFPEPRLRFQLAVPMPNHFHNLAEATDESAPGNVARRAMNSYTKAYNDRHDRSGHLFQSRHQVKVVEGESYLKYVAAYIILNPVSLLLPGWQMGMPVPDREAVIRFLENYRYSNLPQVLCGRENPSSGLLCVPPEEGILRYYGTREALRQQVFAYLG